jgi:hypothetical protein
MTTTGTYGFNPSTAQLGLFALRRCDLQGPALEPKHMVDLVMCANLVLSEWSNTQPHLWDVDQQSFPLVQGTATYTLPPETILLLSAVIRTAPGGLQNDRFIFPVSRDEYMAYPNKTLQAPTTVYWYDRTIIPSVTVYPTPDGTLPYTFVYFRVRQTQDSSVAMGTSPEIPYRFVAAFTAGLTAYMADLYKPEIADRWERKHKELYETARQADRENVNLYFSPGLIGYYPR